MRGLCELPQNLNDSHRHLEPLPRQDFVERSMCWYNHLMRAWEGQKWKLCWAPNTNCFVSAMTSRHGLTPMQGNKLSIPFPVRPHHNCAMLALISEATEFYFNFKDSIFGEICGSATSGSRIISHQHFLATFLLPCGQVDGKIQKFTGSDDIGDAPDNITKAIHAFTHFLLLYSQGHLLFCDLQGVSCSNSIDSLNSVC